MGNGFVHLHVHTEYSLLDGMGKIKDVVRKVKASGMTACAITDHGAGYGLVEFYNECVSQGIKPILGVEAYEAPGSRYEKTMMSGGRDYYHLILLVKNETGYKNLCRLISRSNTEGFYYKPRIDRELLGKYHEGLVCMSACIAGRIPQDILKGDLDRAKEDILWYQKLFGDDFYLEIQNHGLQQEALAAQEIVRLSKETGVRLVCTNDCHYINSDDKEAHEWLLCIQTDHTINDPDRMIYDGDYSIKTENEMRALFPSLPEAFDNTIEIAQKCNFDFVFGNYRMPKVVIPENYGTDYFRYMQDEAWKGWEKRYPEGNEWRQRAKERLVYELGVVEQMGFAEYFLDTRKTILWAHDHYILTGPGRGSAAGSVMCYCLDITDVEPLRYNLLFERFLNPERISMPDIDVDYDYAYQQDIVAFEAQSNGIENFAKIQTFGSMLAKGVLRDCARVASYPPKIGTKLSKLVPNELGMTLDKAYEQNPELKAYVSSDPGIQKLWNVARKLEGLKKSASTHACGHIPTPVPCEELFPVSMDHETGLLICQYNMSDAEHLGNLKKDLLMLRNLTIINTAQKSILSEYNVEVPLWDDQILNDKAALALIASGDTNGVFQLESDGMKSFLKDLRPDCFEDVIAAVALYRPGPMDFIPKYIEGKYHPENITYLTPELEDILAPTYGCIVYQEQVMQIVQKLAGFSMGRADVVRKAMGKKKMDIMQAERENFIHGNRELGIPGCVANGISEKVADQIYDAMIEFAKYAFNKSHAACYAVIAMQTAYLKAHYPKEFWAGVLTSVMDKLAKLVIYASECKSKGISILPPDLNTSGKTFAVTKDGDICYGLLAIKGVGADVVEEILNNREENGPFRGLLDFIRRVPSVGKGAVESFIKAGAFDFTGYNRKTMLENMPSMISSIRNEKKKQTEGQLSFMDLLSETDHNESVTIDMVSDCLKELPDYEKKERLRMEKEATGMYISSHPLDELEPFIRKRVSTTAAMLNPVEEGDSCHLADGETVTVAGIITKLRNTYTKKDAKPMAFLTIEDKTGEISVVVFPKQYAMCKDVLEENRIVLIGGTISLDSDKGNSVLADSISDMEMMPKKIWVKLQNRDQYMERIAQINQMADIHQGIKDTVVVYIEDTKDTSIRRNCILADAGCLTDFSETFGAENVAVTI